MTNEIEKDLSAMATRAGAWKALYRALKEMPPSDVNYMSGRMIYNFVMDCMSEVEGNIAYEQGKKE